MLRVLCNKIWEGFKYSEWWSVCEIEFVVEKKKEEEWKLERVLEEVREMYNYRNFEDKFDYMCVR